MIEQLKSDFNKMAENLKFSESNVELRKKNLTNFIDKGFPNKRIEDWKFSDLNQIISSNINNLHFYNDLKPNKIDKTIFIDKFEHNTIVFLYLKLCMKNDLVHFLSSNQSLLL